MAQLHDVVFDCRHPASLARFWVTVLDDYAVAPYDADELERLRSIGVDDPEDDPTVLVEAVGRVPRLCFQRVPEEKVAKNRLHVDMRSDEPAQEAERLVALGARVIDRRPTDTGEWFVLADPEGNEFCLSS